MRDRILLFTGGLDSVCAWHLLDQPPCLYIEQRENDENVRHAMRAASVMGLPEIEIAPAYWWFAGLKDDGHVPLRNLHLATVGALHANHVLLGAVKGESSPDKSDKFLRATSRALTAASQNRKIKVEAPLKTMTKRQMVEAFLNAVGRKRGEEVIAATRSCYGPGAGQCGCCMACFRRWVALSLNGIYEHHERPPWNWSPPPWRERATYLRDAPTREWPGIAQNNFEAWMALTRSTGPRTIPRALAHHLLSPRLTPARSVARESRRSSRRASSTT